MSKDFTTILKGKKAIIVELDDVLFPVKDYDLQVYYLFAQFLEMSGEEPASAMMDFLKSQTVLAGRDEMFDRLNEAFDYVGKYRTNFDRLYKTARLPLKLFMYQSMFDFLASAVKCDIPVFLVTEGDAETELNKIKQLNWLGLEKNIKIFFADAQDQPFKELISNLLVDNNLSPQDTLMISKNKRKFLASKFVDLTYILSTDINN